MFIKTFKVKKKAGAAVLGILLAALIAAAVLIARASSGKADIYTLKTEEDRQTFIAEMGWEADEEYEECKVVLIPENWNDVYTKYNELQKEQGFDLEKYKGRTCEIYSYHIHNYEGYEDSEDVYIDLYICDGVLIGGDVCCTRLDGFMQGLRKA